MFNNDVYMPVKRFVLYPRSSQVREEFHGARFGRGRILEMETMFELGNLLWKVMLFLGIAVLGVVGREKGTGYVYLINAIVIPNIVSLHY